MRLFRDTESMAAKVGLTAEEARAEWVALANEAGFTNDFSLETLLDRLERVVATR